MDSFNEAQVNPESFECKLRRVGPFILAGESLSVTLVSDLHFSGSLLMNPLLLKLNVFGLTNFRMHWPHKLLYEYRNGLLGAFGDDIRVENCLFSEDYYLLILCY